MKFRQAINPFVFKTMIGGKVDDDRLRRRAIKRFDIGRSGAVGERKNDRIDATTRSLRGIKRFEDAFVLVLRRDL